jgi:hypothetical protein
MQNAGTMLVYTLIVDLCFYAAAALYHSTEWAAVQEQLDKVPLFAQAIKEERQELARRVRSLTVGTEDYIIRVCSLSLCLPPLLSIILLLCGLCISTDCC